MIMKFTYSANKRVLPFKLQLGGHQCNNYYLKYLERFLRLEQRIALRRRK